MKALIRISDILMLLEMQNVIFNLCYSWYRIRIDSANIWVFGSKLSFEYDICLVP